MIDPSRQGAARAGAGIAPLGIRPYQLMCLVCQEGRDKDVAEGSSGAYFHEARLEAIREAFARSPAVPVRLRCNTDTVFRHQNPGREHDTPEGAAYNVLRDLTVLQRLGAMPGDTRPARDWMTALAKAIPAAMGVCAYPETVSPGWPRCRFAESGNYERGLALGVEAVVRSRPPEERAQVKRASADACAGAERLRIRPHHLMCMACFHGGRPSEAVAPIAEDNLQECIAAMQKRPDLLVELVAGPCMVCAPCPSYDPASGQCVGGNSMGVRDEKKDLDVLRVLGLNYGDTLPARDLLQRVFNRIRETTQICSFVDGLERGKEWRVCGGPAGSPGYVLARLAGIGVPGARPDAGGARVELTPKPATDPSPGSRADPGSSSA